MSRKNPKGRVSQAIRWAVENMSDDDRDTTLRSMFQDPEGFAILGQEMFLPLRSTMNERLAMTVTPGTDTAGFSVLVWAFFESFDDITQGFCNDMRMQALGALQVGCDLTHLCDITELEVEPFNRFTKVACTKGWKLTAKGHVQHKHSAATSAGLH